MKKIDIEELSHREVANGYERVILRLLSSGQLSACDDVLVVCGGELDRATLLGLNFKNVIISNVDERMVTDDSDTFSPYHWKYINAENMDLPDSSFDVVIVHSGLHHCHSPHRALLEMYRVARKALVVFEPLDNLFTKVGAMLGFGQKFEITAVIGNDMRYGGVQNTQIPNYVYRWSPQQVKHTIGSYAPEFRHRFIFFFLLRLPWHALAHRKSRLFFRMMQIAEPFLRLAAHLIPSLNNNLAFVVIKPSSPRDLWPWLKQENGEIKFDKSYALEKFR